MLVRNSVPEQHKCHSYQSHAYASKPGDIFRSFSFKRSAPLGKRDLQRTAYPVFVLREAHRTFWTRTVWTDASSMKSFMLSGVHRQVMPSLLVCGATRLPLPIGFGFAGTSVVGRRCIDGCSMMEDVPKSTIRQKRTAASRFLLLSSGRLENCGSSDPMTAANVAAQRSLRVDVRIPSFTNRRTPQ